MKRILAMSFMVTCLPFMLNFCYKNLFEEIKSITNLKLFNDKLIKSLNNLKNKEKYSFN